MAVRSSARSRIHWVCMRCVTHRLANFCPCSLSVWQRWLCACSAGTAVRRSVCEATQHNTTEPMWFFGRLVCVSLAHLARVRAVGAATATGWLLNLEGWAIGYLGNQRENHSILLAAYHARGESSSQKTLRCILPTRWASSPSHLSPSLPLSSLLTLCFRLCPSLSSPSLSSPCISRSPHGSQSSLGSSLFSRQPVNPPIVSPHTSAAINIRGTIRPSTGPSIINNFVGSS